MVATFHPSEIDLEARADHAGLRRRGIAMLLAASVLWSLSGLAVKLAAMDPLAFAMWRSLAGAVALGVAIPLGRGRWPGAKWMIPTVLCYTAVVSLLLAAMTWGTAARGILLQYTGPVFCAIFAWLFQRRRIGLYNAGALLVAGAGSQPYLGRDRRRRTARLGNDRWRHRDSRRDGD